MVLIPGSIFLRAIWRGNVNFTWNFFQIAEIPQGRALEKINPESWQSSRIIYSAVSQRVNKLDFLFLSVLPEQRLVIEPSEWGTVTSARSYGYTSLPHLL